MEIHNQGGVSRGEKDDTALADPLRTCPKERYVHASFLGPLNKAYCFALHSDGKDVGIIHLQTNWQFWGHLDIWTSTSSYHWKLRHRAVKAAVFLLSQPTLAIICKGTVPQLLFWGSVLFLCSELWCPLWGPSTSLCLSQHNCRLCCVLPDPWRFEVDRQQTKLFKMLSMQVQGAWIFGSVCFLILW